MLRDVPKTEDIGMGIAQPHLIPGESIPFKGAI